MSQSRNRSIDVTSVLGLVSAYHKGRRVFRPHL